MNARKAQVLLALALGLMALLGVVGVLAAGEGRPTLSAQGTAAERVTAGTVTQTLMALYNSTNGDGWTDNSGWGSGNPYCTWYGVTCSGGVVNQLILADNNLTGPLPPELGDLSTLQSLYLGYNSLSGPLPPELGALSDLRNLDLSPNNLSGAIPPELGSLSSLQSLYLDNNNLRGAIPPELGELGNLRYLLLSANNLGGAIPTQLGQLGNLEYLYLSDNNLSGAVPPVLGDLSSLRSLRLSGNNLTGAIPPQLGELSNLEYLVLSDNNLIGPIPAALAGLSALVNLSLQDNPYLTCWATEDALAWALELSTYGGPKAVCFLVDREATGGAQTGTSWADAFTDLQSALAVVLTVPEATAEVWVAEGTYTPTVKHGGTGDRFESFQMKNGFALYGGFDPSVGDVALDDRDWEANRTVLSGDIGDEGSAADNSYHVFYHPAGTNLDGSAILDGFIITGGNADASYSPDWDGGGMYNYSGSSPILRHCTFAGNSARFGGGLYINTDSSPSLIGCTFEGNSALYAGAGIYIANNSSLSLTNCVFQGNSAGERGGAIHNVASGQLMLVNCTLEGNSAELEGGAVFNQDSTTTVINSILWGNTAPLGSQIRHVGTGQVTVSFSDIQGGVWSGTGNISEDPLFWDAGAGNLRLALGSPAIDAGDNNAVTGVATDLAGGPRILNGIVDMGAYEAQPPVYLPLTLRNYAPLTNGGFESGWAGWTHGGTIPQTITSADAYQGSYAALLGDPGLPCAQDVNVGGTAWAEQTFSVPISGATTLVVRYQVVSYDSYEFLEPDLYDRFEIRVNGEEVLSDGNDSGDHGCEGGPWTEGWEEFQLPLAPYQGSLITLRLQNVLHPDRWFNTWTYVDDIHFLP